MTATPIRHIRIPDDQWQQLDQAAKDKGIPVSAMIRAMIRDYLAKPTRLLLAIVAIVAVLLTGCSADTGEAMNTPSAQSQAAIPVTYPLIDASNTGVRILTGDRSLHPTGRAVATLSTTNPGIYYVAVQFTVGTPPTTAVGVWATDNLDAGTIWWLDHWSRSYTSRRFDTPSPTWITDPAAEAAFRAVETDPSVHLS